MEKLSLNIPIEWKILVFSLVLSIIIIPLLFKTLRHLSKKLRYINELLNSKNLLLTSLVLFFSSLAYSLMTKANPNDFVLWKGLFSVLQLITIFALCNIFIHHLFLFLEKKAHDSQNKYDDLLVPMIKILARLLLCFIIIYILGERFNINVKGLLAGFGIGGLAVAFAAKDFLANLLGSLTVIFDRPFEIGDYIKIKDIEGTVIQVGLRSTRIRTFYDSLVSIPNSMVTNECLDNFGKRRKRRFRETLSVEYSTSTKKINEFQTELLKLFHQEKTIQNDLIRVHLNKLSASSLDLQVYFFFLIDDYQQELELRHHLFCEILDIAKRLDINFAFPSQSIYVNKSESV